MNLQEAVLLNILIFSYHLRNRNIHKRYDAEMEQFTLYRHFQLALCTINQQSLYTLSVSVRFGQQNVLSRHLHANFVVEKCKVWIDFSQEHTIEFARVSYFDFQGGQKETLY